MGYLKRLSLIGVLLALVLGFSQTGASQSAEGIVVVPDTDKLQVSIDVQDELGNSRPSFQIDERVRIVVNTQARNANRVYLNVVDIDAAGKCTLIFPNAFSTNPRVPVGRFVLPDRPGYHLRVVPPRGQEFVQAFASLQPLDLRDLFHTQSTSGNPFPTVCTNPEEFARQVQGAIQGLVPEGEVATAWTSFRVGAQPANRPPVASFNVSNKRPQIGESVFFNASDSFDPDGHIARYKWHFGDGATARGRFVSHTYRSAGRFTATLRVTDNQGATSATSQTINIRIQDNQAPVASFSVTPANPRTFETATFTSNSFDPDGFIVQHRWDFGDGFTAGGSTAFHAYSSPGIFTATLTVTDNQGRSASTSQQVLVGSGQPSRAGFTIDAVDETHFRISVQGRPSWFSSRSFRIELETNGRFVSVDRRTSGTASAQGIAPTPVDQKHLTLTGSVRNGRIDYTIGISRDTSKIKFGLKLDIDGDGQLEQRRDFVFLGSQMKHPPSNPFVLSFPRGRIEPFVHINVCLVLVDQPGFQFTICFKFGSL